ncbi:dihydroneopterin aldolase [Prosthecobacter fusiformis]|uniref:dihydroneopterin aldolase n=1 Tax=Prosthecobacter fusiformis TaxID=48464 RepID=A0A4R7RMG2_9BACT|nr:dihydroneopterin aldolase [Prosthecobacter fusiformis]TDU66512.1 dihydroneopterin aldolase [Prosthecobacter fusiformis]
MTSPAPDAIHLQGLDLPVQIGVPEEERAAWQTLQADITLGLGSRFEEMQDDLSRTVDYSAVALRLRQLAAERPRQLIETLAAEMAQCILSEFGVNTATITLRKRILPGCDYVAVSLSRP